LEDTARRGQGSRDKNDTTRLWAEQSEVPYMARARDSSARSPACLVFFSLGHPYTAGRTFYYNLGFSFLEGWKILLCHIDKREAAKHIFCCYHVYIPEELI